MCVHEVCRKEIVRLEAERDALKEELAEERAVNLLMADELVKRRMNPEYQPA